MCISRKFSHNSVACRENFFTILACEMQKLFLRHDLGIIATQNISLYSHCLAYLSVDIATETPVLEELYDYVYAEFMEEIDAVDNGISDRDGEPR